MREHVVGGSVVHSVISIRRRRNRNTLIALAAATFALLLASAAMGQDFGEGNDLLWTIGDVVWFGFLGCALALIVLSVGVLVRSRTRSGSRSLEQR